MRRSHLNLNYPLLYKQWAAPPQVLFIPHINHLLRNQPSDSSECFPRKEHILSLILTVYSLSRLRSIGSLFGTYVVNGYHLMHSSKSLTKDSKLVLSSEKVVDNASMQKRRFLVW
ncbi:hypothetical protein PIB30_014904 [Stylosanthes scabra]|uniref:Uncharacterized protein n=1 Tax=Stylosanthes scabra TaxID=79078 RepID=A0ABU6U762_9FABA|nr:hypothetical protein [Stylosanthes scabra]